MRNPLLLALLLLGLSTASLDALTLSPEATVSLITEDPGREIYLAFGHTAVRVTDPQIGLDRLYNFGTIDPRYLTDPSFVARFLAGDLRYSLGVSRFRDAVAFDLQYEFRNWYEQVYAFTPDQVQKVYDALEWNAREENRVYAYDFLLDNCSTRVPALLEKALGPGVISWGKRPTPTTARLLVEEKLGHRPWWRFWSLFALGSQTTAPATDALVLFLPDELFRATADSTIVATGGAVPLVELTRQVVEGAPRGTYDEPNPDPGPWLWCLVVLALALWPFRATGQWFDRIFFFLLGLGGCILVGLTFFSTHAAAQSNWNLLWINPLGFLAFAVVLQKPQRWHALVWLVIAVPTAAILALGWAGPQSVVLDHVPLLLIILIRSARQLFLSLGFSWYSGQCLPVAKKTS